MKLKKLLVMIGPGILVAATGVGAGDLATSAFTGQKLGLAVLWAVIVGACMKYAINEGLTRWQLATGDTLLEGCVRHIGQPFKWMFLVYLLLWSFLVGGALISAAGVTLHAMIPIWGAQTDKLLYGAIQSGLAVLLVSAGGYRLFEKVMTVCIGAMFLIVVATAVALRPNLGQFLQGALVPRIPEMGGGGLEWTIALMGGVGGTLTVLCYAYWIREEGRHKPEELTTCRIDLAAGYIMTALFGMAMVVIGSRMTLEKTGGAGLLIELANGLLEPFGQAGPMMKWSFLIGAWCAIFSSLLGVWQSVPYLFTDFWMLVRDKQQTDRVEVDDKSPAYRCFLYGLATVPCLGVWLFDFKTMQKTYAVVGALIIPALSGILLVLNNRSKLVGQAHKNRWLSNLVLAVAIIFFAYFGWLGIKKKLGL